MPNSIDDETIASQLASIRAALRTRMDGSVAQSMRASGLDYRYNWGWTRGYLLELAAQYQPSRELAEALRESAVRELLILSTMLFPREELTEQDVEAFLEKVTNVELQEQLAFNLLAYVPLAIRWAEVVVLSNATDESKLYVALLTIANYTKRQPDKPLPEKLMEALELYVSTEELPMHCRRVAYDLLITLEERTASND
ncbi:peptidase [uncultured Porphyromonas sp.]|uniref:peptidase n=1 Tax=uncultured Porphyromonas sp. TaxID=159274 RepID=UPI002606E7D0|nr:peptidase [uncultured Porphyromonas sp.]